MSAPAPTHAITNALAALRAGDPGAMDQLVPLVYEELARIAHRQLGLEAPGHTLSTTALVHEAYLRLVDQTRAQWADRAQFFGVAAHSMRRVLVDHARRHRAARRGGSHRRDVPLEVQTICVHGDTPGAATLARALRGALEAAGISVRPVAAGSGV